MSTPVNIVRVGGERASLRYRPRTVLVSALLAAVITLLAVLSIGLSDVDRPIAPGDVIATVFGYGDGSYDFVILRLRLPRVIIAMLIGVAFGMSGAIFQSVSRNPLGSPDIIGLTTGSATGAVLGIIVWPNASVSISVFAIAGGLATAIAVYLLAWKRGVQGYRLVLVGIGIGAMLTSLNSYLLTRSDLADAMAAQVWLTGSLNGRSWEYIPPLLVAMAVLVPFVIAYARRLALLEMGDDAAKALGISVERTRFSILLAGVALSAVATAAAGPIGFVALAAPQIARRLMRAPGVGLVSAGLMGALLLVASDFVAQRLVPSTELPVGVVTGAVGGGYLAWLLAQGWRASRA